MTSILTFFGLFCIIAAPLIVLVGTHDVAARQYVAIANVDPSPRLRLDEMNDRFENLRFIHTIIVQNMENLLEFDREN